MTVGAGQLRTRLTAYQRVGVRDSTGEEVLSFQELTQLYASIDRRTTPGQPDRATYSESDGYSTSIKTAFIVTRETDRLRTLVAGDIFFHPPTERMFRIQGEPSIQGERYAYLLFDTEVVRESADQLLANTDLSVTYVGGDPAATVAVASDGIYLTSSTEGAQSVLFADHTTIQAVERAINALLGWEATLDPRLNVSPSDAFDEAASQIVEPNTPITLTRS